MPETTPFAFVPSSPGTKAFRSLGPVFFYFFIAGIATVMLGPLLPALIARWHIRDSQAGTLFAVTFAGQFCGAWFATRNLRAGVLYGSLMTAAGCALLAWADFRMAHLALFCVGLGLGSGLTAGNVITGTVLPALRTRLLAILNASWGLGAILCSLLVRECGPNNVRLFFLMLSGCLFLAAVFALTLPHAASAIASHIPQRGREAGRRPVGTLSMVVFGIVMLLYVGVENALGGWLPSYGVRSASVLSASSIALYFWVSELCGRLLLTSLTGLLGEAALYRGGIILLLLTEVMLILVKRPETGEVVALTVLSGFALAPLYPLIVSFFLARTGNHPGLGPIFALASLGGSLLPWLTGVISTEFHGLRAGLMVPAAGAALMLLLYPAVVHKPTENPSA